MSTYEMREIRDYADPKVIADDLLYNRYASLDLEEAQLAGELISQRRGQFVLEAIKTELAERQDQLVGLEEQIETAHIIYLPDMISDECNWPTYTTRDESKRLIERSGYFVDLRDFVDAHSQVHTSREYAVNLFHTLVLFFLKDDPSMYTRAEAQLRYNPSNHSAYNEDAPSHRYFLRAQTLIEYAKTKVLARHKIPGVGVKGRELIRVVLFDEDIDTAI